MIKYEMITTSNPISIYRYPSYYELYSRIRTHLRFYKLSNEINSDQYLTLTGHAKRINKNPQNYINLKNWFIKNNHIDDWNDICTFSEIYSEYIQLSLYEYWRCNPYINANFTIYSMYIFFDEHTKVCG